MKLRDKGKQNNLDWYFFYKKIPLFSFKIVFFSFFMVFLPGKAEKETPKDVIMRFSIFDA